MQINFEKLIGRNPIAVHLPTKKDAELFLQEMRRVYPKKVRCWSSAHFAASEERNGGVCYCPWDCENCDPMDI